MVCYIADAVLAGGIRRAALISLFSMDDEEMLTSKYGNWWELNPQRGRANNSAVIRRHRITRSEFKTFWTKVQESNAGEPGMYFTNNSDYGTNPCCEIALKPFQFCNLTEVNVSNIESQEDLEKRCKLASLLGTLQASFANFHYLRPIWRTTTEKDALIGVGMTGIGSGTILKYELNQAAKVAMDANEYYAKLLGINKAARVTTIKPSGTTSCVLGTSSGIHAWHNDYYIRRMQCTKDEELYKYLAKAHPELVVDM
jgi:ribonucleoside-diphosphate reductase alpha chain